MIDETVSLAEYQHEWGQFAEAEQDRLAVALGEPRHQQVVAEGAVTLLAYSRYITFGLSSLGRLLAVSHTYRPGKIRIINARRVTRTERKLYEEG